MDSNQSFTPLTSERIGMGYTPDRARMEAALARAHRGLAQAREAAESLGDDGAAHDIHQIEREVVRVAEGSLRGRPNRRSRDQTSLYDPELRGA